MGVTHVFAGVAVTDYEPALDWYERLLGRPPDVIPKDDEAVWQLTSSALLYIVADSARAGTGLVTLAVDDLDAHLAGLARRGLAPGQIDTGTAAGRKAVVSDPDGNTITFFENRSP
jgi:catechol 2,3-dioxygenase-like lactoylglutathione lyase family enzyme